MKIRKLIAKQAIVRRNQELARQIDAEFRGASITAVIVTNGAIIFAADLLRLLNTPVTFDTISASSYAGSQSTNTVTMRSLPKSDLKGHDILLIDDILDTGNTLHAITQFLRGRRPRSIKTCVLLNKRRPRRWRLRADYVGFEIDDVFVVGYGLDYNESYRNLPYIGVLG